MTFTREQFMDRMMRGYAYSHDLAPAEHPTLPLIMTAHYHVTESQYIIFKEAKMWSANSDEYVYFFSAPKLTGQIVKDCIRYAYDEGMAKIDLSGQVQHMCTRITTVFICDEADEDAAAEVKNCRLYKSFQFSLKGWMEFHTALADLGKESAVSNRYGRETAKFLKNLLRPGKGRRGSKFWSILKEMLH